jgi:hypothetical protein
MLSFPRLYNAHRVLLKNLAGLATRTERRQYVQVDFGHQIVDLPFCSGLIALHDPQQRMPIDSL